MSEENKDGTCLRIPNRELPAILGVSRDTVYAMLHDGTIPSTTYGSGTRKRFLVFRADIDQLVNGNK